MHSLTRVSVVVCVVRKPRPCLSYSRRRDRINSVLWRSYYKGGGVLWTATFATIQGGPRGCSMSISTAFLWNKQAKGSALVDLLFLLGMVM